jgi:hypothetical protein
VPIATIHVLEGRYDERRLGHVSKAVQDALDQRPEGSLGRFLSSDPRAAAQPVSTLPLVSGENYSLGQGLAQRAVISAGTVADGVVPITPAPVNGEL